ncbi:hypothetical protein ACLKA6_002321 [Drosophila palustris]
MIVVVAVVNGAVAVVKGLSKQILVATRIRSTVLVVTRTLSENPCGNKDQVNSPRGNKDFHKKSFWQQGPSPPSLCTVVALRKEFGEWVEENEGRMPHAARLEALARKHARQSPFWDRGQGNGQERLSSGYGKLEFLEQVEWSAETYGLDLDLVPRAMPELLKGTALMWYIAYNEHWKT